MPQPALVLFSGRWCGACAAMQPVWQNFVRHYHGPLKLVYVDVDLTESQDYRTYAPLWESDRSMPQVCRVDARGRVLERRTGLLTQRQLGDFSRGTKK